MGVVCGPPTVCQTNPDACKPITAGQLAGLAIIEIVIYCIHFGAPRIDPQAPRIAGLPIAVSTSGGYIPLFIATFAFTVIFFELLTGLTLPCTGPVADCNTISCICGNYLFQGYVFMFFTLGLGAYIIFKTTSDTMRPFAANNVDNKSWDFYIVLAVKLGILFGAAAVVWTGIFPFEEAKNIWAPVAIFDRLAALHIAGLALALFFVDVVPFLWFCHTRKKREVSVRALVSRCVVMGALLIYIIAWAFTSGSSTLSGDDVSNFCAQRVNQAQCEMFPCYNDNASSVFTDLSDAAQTASVVNNLRIGLGPQHGVITNPPRYTCVWDPVPVPENVQNYSLPYYVTALNNKGCRKDKCTIFGNALSIMLEFGVLMLMFYYALAYGVPDAAAIADHVLGQEAIPTTDEADAGQVELTEVPA